MSKTEIYKEIKTMDPKLKQDDECFRAAAIMLTALNVGLNQKRVSQFLDYPSADVATVFQRLEKSGVFKKRKIHCTWADPEEGGISFWMDVGVAVGWFKRA